MVTRGLCTSCRTEMPPLGQVEPLHCFGSGDMPVPRGRMGGFRCECPCRTWTKEEARG